MPWFHGKITREEAEALLTPSSPGLYLVRESTNFPGDYTLCVWFVPGRLMQSNLTPASSSETIIDHYRIMGKDGKITIDEETYFGSLEELIKVRREFVDLFGAM